MGLYKRGKVWFTSFTANGKRFQRSTGTSDKRLAEDILSKIRVQIIEHKWFEKKVEEKAEHTFRELAEKYAQWAEGRQRGYKRAKAGYCKAILVEKFGDMNLAELDTHTVEQLQTEILQKGREPATVNRITSVISHMFTKAKDWKMVDNGTAIAVRVKKLQENNRRLRYLSKEECQSLVNACDKHLKPLVVTALHTGMRKSEIFNLKWDNVDLKHGFILLGITKNGERREIPINETLRQTLQGLVRRLDIPHVFYNAATNKPFTVDIKRSFNTALKRAGIRDFRFHDLRHTFASQLIMAGVDLTTVKELLGHKDIKMTLRYIHLAPSHNVRAVDVLDKTLSGEKCYNFATADVKGLQSIP